MFKVLKAGFYSTIQDLGRFGFQKYGVPVSGVMDRSAAISANVVLGNIETAAVLEITMLGPTLQFHSETYICISGADMAPSLNSLKIKRNAFIQISKGDILTFGKLMSGFRCYLAISGGFKTEMMMNSYSMYKGITAKYMLYKGDQLPINKLTRPITEYTPIKINSDYFKTNIIDVFKGPEFDLLSNVQIKQLFSKELHISNHYNRMGYQLVDPLPNTLKPIITSLVMPGTVQLTPSGKLIILMRDCQTTGGYPRILQLSEDAINILSQKYVGQVIVFRLLNSK